MVTYRNVSDVADDIARDIYYATYNFNNDSLVNKSKIQNLILDKSKNELHEIVYNDTFSRKLNLTNISNNELWDIVKKHCF